ncbi:MAG: choice-of-anchor Q domain-containing protein [Acidobacteriota bacterium]
MDRGAAPGAPALDLEGRVRPAGAAVDIGAYEFSPAGLGRLVRRRLLRR